MMQEHSLLLESPPHEWVPCKFGDLCERVKDTASPLANGRRLYLGLEHLASGRPALVGRGIEVDVKSGKTEFRTGDVLFGKLRPYLRKAVIAPESGICSTDILVLRATKRATPEFICFLVHCDEFIEHAKATTSGVQHPRTSWSALRDFELHVPAVDEQKNIAKVLALTQRAMEQQERTIQLTMALKKSLLKKLFAEGLRNEERAETGIGLMPESWTATPLGDCCHVLSGSLSYTDFLKLPPSDVNDAIECMAVKVSDMNLPGNERRFCSANAQKRLPLALAQKKLVPANAVVFPKRGAAIATNKKRLTSTWTVLDPNLIAVRPKNNVDCDFLYFWTQTFDLKTITDPGPTPQLNKKDLTPLLIPVPPDIKEQQEIAGVLSTVDTKIELHRRREASLSDLFRVLLHELITAKIRVLDLNISDLESAVAA